jgi:glycine/D-amino acid oxidase-like deaminating enzyme
MRCFFALLFVFWPALVSSLVLRMNTKAPVVIVGGGIHGASVAYYLRELGRSSIILEKAPHVAPAASGKSGGFLAREWGSGPTVQLHQKGFDLHVEVAKKLGITSFRELGVLSVSSTGRRGLLHVSWLDRASRTSLLDGAAAQVTPLELTEKLMESSGAEVRLGTTAVGVDLSDNDAVRQVTGVRCSDGSVIETDTLVIAAGPWSGVLVEDWFDVELPMEGVRSTSIVFKGGGETVQREFKALFCDEDEYGCHTEVYPRPDGSLYLCGLGGSKYVKGDDLREGGAFYFPASVTADPLRVAAGLRSFRALSSLGDAEPAVTQACMRPLHPDALPTMSSVPGVAGAFVSCGHNCWGILWSLVSGRAMAELVVQGKPSIVDLRPFSAQRFTTGAKAKTARGRAMGETQVGEQW